MICPTEQANEKRSYGKEWKTPSTDMTAEIQAFHTAHTTQRDFAQYIQGM